MHQPLFDLYGKPYRVNYIARYSLCLREGIRSTFAQDVVRTVDICTDLASIFAAVQALSPSNAPAAKAVLFLVVGCVGRNRVKIEKAGLTGIALLARDDLDAHQLCLVLEHRDEARVRHEDKVLIRSLP